MRYRVWFLVCMIIIAVSPSSAQQVRKTYGGFGGFIFGASKQDMTDFNKTLKNSGYRSYENQSWMYGGGGFAVLGRFLFGGESHALMARNTVSENALYRVKLRGAVGQFKIGYILLQKGSTRFYPFVGLGESDFILEIAERIPADFEDILDQPARSSRLRVTATTIDAGWGALYTLFDSGRRSGGGFAIGLQIGYRFTPAKNDWERFGGDTEGRSIPLWNGPYVTLLFGAGGFGVR